MSRKIFVRPGWHCAVLSIGQAVELEDARTDIRCALRLNLLKAIRAVSLASILIRFAKLMVYSYLIF